MASGLASAGLASSGEFGTLPRFLLMSIAPLPLFASGLSAGTLSALAAGLAGAVAVTLGQGPAGGASYLAAAAIPVAVLVRRAVRPAATRDGGRSWRTGGDLLLWLAGLGLVGVFALIGYFAVFEHGLPAMIAERFGLEPLPAAMAARIAPGLGVAVWMALIAVDGAVAEWIVARLGRAIRPPEELRRLTLPFWIGPILMVAGLAGAALRHGTVGMVCLNSAIVLIVPFAFLGLALLHALAGNRPGGAALIAAAYVVMLATPALFGWRAMLMLALGLAGLGSADQLVDFRDLRGLRSGMRRK
jgi:hypothetical protein